MLVINNDYPQQMGLWKIFTFHFCHFWLAEIVLTIHGGYFPTRKRIFLTPSSLLIGGTSQLEFSFSI